MCIAHDPGIRLREIAATVGVTERSAFAIVSDLAAAGYVVKRRDGRRNRYEVQTHLPLPDAIAREPTIGEILELLVDTDRRERRTETDGERQRGRSARRTDTTRASAARDGL